MPKKILVADDDQGILDVMRMILELEGYEVRTTQDGSLVRDLSLQSPDLLLLDIGLSGYDGKEICLALKARKKTKHMPIIMVSANKDIARITKEAGADGFVIKPFDMNDLLSTVATYANK